jgi:DNA repair protein RadC
MYQLRSFTVEFNQLVVEEECKTLAGMADLIAIMASIYATLDVNQEHFIVLALDSAVKPIGYKRISSGCMDSTTMDMRLVFQAAFHLGAYGIAVAHNHTNRQAIPSAADLRNTEQLMAAASLVGMPVMDAIIFAYEEIFSYRLWQLSGGLNGRACIEDLPMIDAAVKTGAIGPRSAAASRT